MQPLTIQDIFDKILAENARSKSKYGFWKDITESEQAKAIMSEVQEWNEAREAGDVDGPHGELIEAIQCASIFIRRIQYLSGSADA